MHDYNKATPPMSEPLDPIFQEEQRRLRIQLFWRLGLACALVIIVLLLLTWLDNHKPEDPEIQRTVAPTQVRIATPVATASIASAEPVASQASATNIASAVASLPAVASSATTAAPPLSHIAASATASHTAAASIPVQPEPKPQAIAHTDMHKLGPLPPGVTIKPDVEPIPEPIQPSKSLPPVSKPMAPPAAPPPPVNRPAAVAVPRPVTNIASKAATFSIQAGGVFLHAASAEKLLKQLQAAGVPAYIETRVQIGPFKTKAEADAATEKIRKMGITPAMAP